MAAQTPGAQGISQEDRTYGTLCHLTALAGILLPLVGNWLGPLITWLLKREGHPFVDEQGKESLNFEISITIYAVALGIVVCIVAGLLTLVTWGLFASVAGLFVLLAGLPLGIFQLVEIILASVKANQGIPYRYPLTIRFVK